MQVAQLFRKLIIGKNQYISSRAEFKRVIFTGYLSLLCIVSNWAYVIIGVQEDHRFNTWLNFAFCFVCIICLILIRLKKYTTSKLLLFTAAYLIIFIFCTIEPYSTGVYMFLVLISIGAFAMFGFEQRHYSIALSIFGGVLFCVAYLFDFKIWQETYSNEYIFNNFLLNFFMSLFVSVSILYFLVDMNRYSEKSLEKKEAEAIEKNKELTKLNAELDRFVYSVSHDLRSPLSTISGLVNIGKHVENVEEAKKYFALIDGRLKTQDFFIREIIDFYRNSRTEINQEKFQLKEHVQQIVSEFSFSESPVSIRYDLEIADDLEIQTDKIRLRSVLSNLIGNAIKYHDQNKRERFVKVGAERENGHVNIFVEDNGLGIGEEHLAKVFDMFYRASADSKGSGLGLFIVKETVGKLGGKIGVDSRLGKGTKFSFTLSSESVVS